MTPHNAAVVEKKSTLSYHSPKRMHPGSLREFSALLLIIGKNSSIRSGLISASTITLNGFDILSVVVVRNCRDADANTGLLLNEWEQRKNKRQRLVVAVPTIFMVGGAKE